MIKDMELIVKKYYDELDNGKIMGCKCNKCGHMEFPPRLMCNECGSADVDWTEISGKGEMIDCVKVGFSAMIPDFKALGDYGLGIVRLEEGVELNAFIYGVTPKNVTELRANLPKPVHAVIVPRGDYKAVAFKLEDA